MAAAGDDYTDKEMFAVVPQDAYSIKVGIGLSKARLNLDTVLEFGTLLKELPGGQSVCGAWSIAGLPRLTGFRTTHFGAPWVICSVSFRSSESILGSFSLAWFILPQACMTVVWSRPPRWPPISPRLCRVRFLAKYMQIWRGSVMLWLRYLLCKSARRTSKWFVTTSMMSVMLMCLTDASICPSIAVRANSASIGRPVVVATA